MSRLTNIQKDQDLLKSIKLAMHEFALEHNVSANEYFGKKLFFKGDNAGQQYFNMFQPYNGKYLKADELLLILDNLGDYNRIVLDHLTSRYGYTLQEESALTKEDIELIDLLLNFTIANGALSKEYQHSLKDGLLDDNEIDNMILLAHRIVSSLYDFIHVLQAKREE